MAEFIVAPAGSELILYLDQEAVVPPVILRNPDVLLLLEDWRPVQFVVNVGKKFATGSRCNGNTLSLDFNQEILNKDLKVTPFEIR